MPKVAKVLPVVTEEIVTVKRDEKSIVALTTSGKSLAPQLAIKIKTQADLDNAVAMVQVGEAWVAKVVALTEPVKTATHAAHKAAVQLEKDLFAVLSSPLTTLRNEISRYIESKAAEERERQRKLDAAQVEKNRLAAKDAADTARKAGADKETVAEIVEAVKATPAPLARPAFNMPQPASSVTRWDVDREEYDLYELCVAIVNQPKEGNTYLGLVEPNFTTLRNRAIEGRENARIPGFKVVKKSGVAIRG
jgi:hypothetical protein